MGSSIRRYGTGTFLFIGLVLLLVLTPLIVLVPLAKCSNCDGHAVILWSTGPRPKFVQDPRVIMACGRCQATGRITLINLWIKGPDVAN